MVQVVAGYDFSAALTAGGEVYLWGRNDWGQTANGECSLYSDGRCFCDACLGQDVAAPARVAALGTDTVQLALGGRHALALKQGGAVLAGAATTGAGSGSATPTTGSRRRRSPASAQTMPTSPPRAAQAWRSRATAGCSIGV